MRVDSTPEREYILLVNTLINPSKTVRDGFDASIKNFCKKDFVKEGFKNCLLDMDFLSYVVSSVLKYNKLSSVNFGFFNNPNGKDSYFSVKNNTIGYNIAQKKGMSLERIVATLAHEGYHKKLFSDSCHSKVFSKDLPSRVIEFNNEVFKNAGIINTDLFYLISLNERLAIANGSKFTAEFLNFARKYVIAHSFSDFQKYSALQEYLVYNEVIRCNKEKLNKLSFNVAENAFLSRLLPDFYKRANTTFDKVCKDYSKSIKTPLNNDRDLSEAVKQIDLYLNQMSDILSVLPRRENVEAYLKHISLFDELSKKGLAHLIEKDVPFKKSDFTTLAFISNKDPEVVPSVFEIDLIENIDEEVWVKNLIYSVGVKKAKEYISYFKSDFKKSDIKKINEIIGGFDENKPILETSNRRFYNLREVLNFVIKNQTFSGNIKEEEINSKFYEYSNNLACIVNHYASPFDNLECIENLKAFITNPEERKIRDEEETVESNSNFSDYVGLGIANFIKAVRAQGTHEDPSKTVISQKEEYEEKLSKNGRDFISEMKNIEGNDTRDYFMTNYGEQDTSKAKINSIDALLRYLGCASLDEDPQESEALAK